MSLHDTAERRTPPSRGVAFMERADKQCAYPISNTTDSRKMRCCGREAKRGSYCDHHDRRMHLREPVRSQ